MNINISYTPLSKKSLRKIWLWHEDNKESPLSIAYFGACGALGSLELNAVAEENGLEWSKNNHSRLLDIDDAAYALRDTIGRLIFELIKKDKS